MTGPIGPSGPVAGRLTVDLRADGDELPNDVRDALRKADKETAPDFEEFGRKKGSDFGKGFRNASDEHLKNLGRDMENALANVQGNVSLGLFDFNDEEETRARRRGRSLATSLFSGFTDFFKGKGGVGSEIFSSLIGGPVGAFFNIGGKSPLILVLIPVLGAILALVAAVIYGLQAAIALIYLVPSLLFAIGLQAAALFFIFNGLGEVIAAAFAATNAEELDKALEGVNKQVADFVRGLLPWRDFFRELSGQAQFAFFDALNTDKLQAILNNIRGPFGQAIVNISAALGYAANSLLDVFMSPQFAKVIETIGGSTTDWIMGFGPAVANFIEGLNELAIALDPFLDWFGGQFNQTVEGWGDTLKELGKDPDFLGWIEDAKVILGDFMDFFGSVVSLLIVFIQQFIDADKENQAKGGKGFLQSLMEATILFTAFMNSGVGQDALQAFINLLVGLTAAFYIIVAVIFTFVGATTAFAETIGGFFSWLGSRARDTGQLFSDLGATVQVALFAIGLTIHESLQAWGDLFDRLGTTARAAWDTITREIGEFFDELGTTFYNAGVMLMVRLIQGINSMLGPFAQQMDAVGKTAGDRLPQSPADKGPLSGSGDPLLSGQTLVKRLATGIRMETPALERAMNSATGSINFGPGAVQVVYNGGAPPTQQQAQIMGSAAGQGIVGQLNATRLAVRTI